MVPLLLALATVSERARAGALDFDAVYAEVREPVARFALRMLGDEAEAADVAQEAALAIWRGLPRFEGRSSVTTWALGIVANLVRRRLRRRPLEPRAVDPAGAAEAVDAGGGHGRTAEEAAAREELARVRVALLDLPEQQRAALLLAVEGGLPYAEVAEALGMSVANVKVSIHRARKTLAERLEVRA